MTPPTLTTGRRRLIRRGGVAAAVLLALASAVVAPRQAAAAPVETPPATVPSLQRWTPHDGRFVLAAHARVVSAPATATVARRLAAELAAAGLGPVTAVVGVADRPGDIVLRLDPAAPAAPEAYRITVGARLTLAARRGEGAIHAAATALQWLRQSRTVAGGVADDWPNYPERGLMVDTGRQFFTPAWLRARIRQMAALKMNVLQLHLSDIHGFRLASDSHPEITSRQHYTKADIRELVSYAAHYGIEIIPDIGMPGHLNAALAAHPELRLNPARTGPADQLRDALVGGGDAGRIDLSNPASYRFMGDILREFLPLFPGRFWGIGGDEYVADYSRYPQLADYATRVYGPRATGYDTFIGYLNWANHIVRAHGKTTRMWNDGLTQPATLRVDRNIVIDYWSKGATPWIGDALPPQALAAAGHQLSNAAFAPTYYATGGPAATLNTPPELLFGWDPAVFVDGSRLPDRDQHQLRGSMLHVWCDDPTARTEQQITEPVTSRLPIMAQQLWTGTRGIGDYPRFRQRVHTLIEGHRPL
ncbi:MAG: family 20 glycosylhydrolase [Mycobacteriaceae bacterium]|nr:family 20 glycosylhydrolase [Mycobacteriaceae bacterium]